MSGLQTPFFVGDLELENNLFYSPLAGCSDYPFRKMSAKFRPGLIFTEMIKIDSLVRCKKETFQMLSFDPSMHPIGAQICGSDPKMAAKSAQMIEELGFDLIDLNCGCPVDKVTKDGSGSGLLKTPNKIGDLLSNICAHTTLPVTVKIRAGWDDDSINCEEITRIAELAGAKVIFIHGRTRSQGYKGLANRSHIARAKKAANQIMVFGNGDIFDPISALDMFETTQCDGILLSRGTLGNPSIAAEVEYFLKHKKTMPKSNSESTQQLIQHIQYIFAFQPLKRALLEIRKVGCWYAKSHSNMSKLRSQISQIKTKEEVDQIIETLKTTCYD